MLITLTSMRSKTTGRDMFIRIHSPSTPRGVMFWAAGHYGNHLYYTPLAQHFAKNGIAFVQCDFEDSRDGGPEDPVTREELESITKHKKWEIRQQEFTDMINHYMDSVEFKHLPYAVGGHSYGANTALGHYNCNFVRADRSEFANRTDAKAALLLSPQGVDSMTNVSSWVSLQGPCLFGTGTEDNGRDDQDWIWRLEPFVYSTCPAVVYVVEDGDHSHGNLSEGKSKYAPVPNQVSDQLLPLLTNFYKHYVLNDRIAGFHLRLATWFRNRVFHSLGWRK